MPNWANLSAQERADAVLITGLYQAAFGREPDKGGLGYWLNEASNGASIESIAAGFVASEEFHIHYGVTGRDGFVTNLYHLTLGRDPDVPGFKAWHDSNLTDAQLLLSFVRSPEFQDLSAAGVNRVLDGLAHGIAPDYHRPLDGMPAYHAPALLPGDPADIATIELSQALFGIVPHDANAFATDVVSFQAGASAGDPAASWRALGEELFLSGANSFSSLTGGDLVKAEYQAIFGHAPDPASAAHYQDLLLSFSTIIGGSSGAASGALIGQIAYDAEHAGQNVLHAPTIALLDGSVVHFGRSLFNQGPDTLVQTVTNTVIVPTAEDHVLRFTANGVVDSIGQKSDGTLLFGSGVSSGGVTLLDDDTSGVQLFLQPMYRTSGLVVAPTQVQHTGNAFDAFYTLQAGIQDGTHGEQGVNANRSGVSINFGVITGPGGLTDGTVKFELDLEGADHVVRTFTLQTASNGVQAWVDPIHGLLIGDNNNGVASTHTAQNSENFGFSVLGSNANVAPGIYHMELREIGLVGLSAGHTLAEIGATLNLLPPGPSPV